MEFRGYEVTWTDTRKNITYTTPQGYKCRDRKLNGRKYLKEEMEFEFELRKEICRRYAGGTERNIGAGISGAENRRSNGTQLEGADLVTRAAGANTGADPGIAGATGNGNKNYFSDAGADRCSAGMSERHGGVNTAVPEEGFEGSGRSGEVDADSYESDRGTLWASEREVFESNLRAAIANEKVDAKVSADQSHPQRTATHSAVDAAYLTANLLGIFDDDDEVEDCTTRYYGPTLSM
jgi:hypothetical protein